MENELEANNRELSPKEQEKLRLKVIRVGKKHLRSNGSVKAKFEGQRPRPLLEGEDRDTKVRARVGGTDVHSVELCWSADISPHHMFCGQDAPLPDRQKRAVAR